MAVTLRFSQDDALRCRFAISPLWEAHAALYELRDATETHHLPWVRRARTALADVDLSPLYAVLPVRGYTPDFVAPPPVGPAGTFDAELARVRETAPAVAARELALSLDRPGDPEARHAAPELLADPAATVGRLADLLEAVWHAAIEPEWPRLRGLLEADIAYRARLLADHGLARMLDDLHARLSYADGVLTFAAHWGHDRHLDGAGLLLMPSAFLGNRIATGFPPPWQPTLVYPVRGAATLWRPAPDPDGSLARLLGRGRGRVLLSLSEPAATTALAHRLGLAPATVSAHLAVLRSAGLVTADRHRHEVLYRQTALADALITSCAAGTG
ncbi:ArsR family transcriptional regulator [Actinocatenispora thailandica]|uniref:ArsR family transcriptional regulator n=1 Tax=Actinocatenispora thailandica TaxID=227318 RepID=A0A7R7DRB5_9ACTN|nr:DUF5937 family protein [Actinocatenispora thailandica]BCJ36185.1 ArsR family transcriptional regulator [Actinocatenispora thailandica]